MDKKYPYRIKLLWETTIDFGVIEEKTRARAVEEAEKRLAYDKNLKEELGKYKWKLYVKKGDVK